LARGSELTVSLHVVSRVESGNKGNGVKMAEDKIDTEEDEVGRHAVIEEENGKTEGAGNDTGVDGIDSQTVDKRVRMTLSSLVLLQAPTESDSSERVGESTCSKRDSG